MVGYGKAGVKSEGYALFFAENGTLLSKKKIRKDRYNSIARIVVEGTAEPDPPVGAEEETPSALRYSISMLKLRGTS